MPPAETIRIHSHTNSSDIITDKKWVSSFPKSLSDENSSAKFMTRAMFVAFSCIIRYRKILGEECFKTNYITEKLKIRSLSFDNKKSLYISQLLRSASEAIREGVLEELALVVTEKENDVRALEVFSWKMHYDQNNNPSADFTQLNETQNSVVRQLAKIEYAGSSSVRDQLVMMVRSIQVLCQKVLLPLEDGVTVNFRLSYLPRARPDFRVSGFEDSSTFYSLHENCQSATIGQLRPGHHGCDLSCSSTYLADSYEAETVLKKYTDRLADSLGYLRPNTLYQSFLSDETVNMSNGEENRKDSVPQAEPEVRELLEKTAEMSMKKYRSSSKNDEKRASTKTAKKPVGRKRGQVVVNEEPANQEEKEKFGNFGRVRSVLIVSPEKRAKKS